MDTIVETATHIDVTTVSLSQEELTLIVNFLTWMREAKYGSFTAEKVLHKGFIDVVISDRIRFNYNDLTTG